MRRLTGFCLAVWLLAGCAGTHFDWDNARKLKPGMTQPEVTQLMGSPYSVRTAPGKTIWVWSWATGFGDHKAMSVSFVDEKLIEIPEIPASF
jgi:hypothetical protein